MWVMYDSVTVSEIPAHAPAVAGYVGGNFPTYPTLVKEFPAARKLSIAVNAGEDAECLDIETGDATVSEAPTWFRRQVARGVQRPVLYCSVSLGNDLVETMRTHGVARHEFRLWTAHYTGAAHICGPAEGLAEPADGTQWTDKALGRNLDESLLYAHFFPAPVSPLAVLLPRERNRVEVFDRLKVHPGRHPVAYRRVRGELVQRRKEIWLAAVKGLTIHGAHTPKGWDVRHRGARYAILKSRTR
jgi:hypothetical protein